MTNANRIAELVRLHKKYRNIGDGYVEELADLASDLLAALEDAHFALSVSRPMDQSSVLPHNNHVAALDSVRAAIAKAKGE